MKKLLIIKFFCAILIVYIFNTKTFSQDCNCIVGYKNYNSQELKQLYASLILNKGFKKLVKRVTDKGFVKIEDTLAAYGFTGKQENSNIIDDVSFVAFDFFDIKKNQTCSIIQRKKGKDIYTAFIMFPPGEKNFKNALNDSEEWYVNSKNKIVKANSWRKCFRKFIIKHCGGFCLGAIKTCGGFSIIIAGMGVSFGTAVAFFLGCAGALCGSCLAVGAINCL